MTNFRALALALLALATLLTGPPAAAAQFGFGDEPVASAELFVRTEGDRVLAVVRFEIEEGWHLYHDDLGPPDAVGKPTTVELSAAGVTWGEPEFAEPQRYIQAGLGAGGGDTFILGHEELLMVWVEGELAAGASAPAAGAVLAQLDGLTCEDDGLCIPYSESIADAGEGPDAFFERFGSADGADDLDDIDAIFAEGDDGDVFDPFGGDDSKVTEALYARGEGEAVEVVLVLDIEDHWHLYHTDLGPPDAIGKPTTLELEAPGVTFDEPEFPAPKRYTQAGLGDGGRDTFILGHEGRVIVRVAGTLDAGAELPEPSEFTATLSGLTCETNGVCINYNATVSGRGAGPDELFGAEGAASAGVVDGENDRSAGSGSPVTGPAAGAATGPAARTATGPAAGTTEGASADASTAGEEKEGLGAFLGLAVFWGLFTLLMPCTYPMIPITISFFTKQAEARGGNVLPLALAYGGGIVGIFVFIGVVVGGPIISLAQDPIFNVVIGLLFFYFALVLFGAINMNPPRFLMDAAGKASTKGGLIGVFLMGATLVITSFTCTAPFVATLLSVGASGGGLGRLILGMAVFGAVIALPFVFLSLLPGKLASIPKSGAWMGTLKVALGFVELAAAFKFFSNADLVWDLGFLSRELFLALWMAIFATGGAFVLGLIKLKGESGEIGPGRMVAGVAFVMLATYSGYGASGRMLDPIMTAIAPPYSHAYANGGPRHGGGDESGPTEHDIVEDDYDEALARASRDDKLLLVNFTGHT